MKRVESIAASGVKCRFAKRTSTNWQTKAFSILRKRQSGYVDAIALGFDESRREVYRRTVRHRSVSNTIGNGAEAVTSCWPLSFEQCGKSREISANCPC